MADEADVFDVIVIGAGPVGITAVLARRDETVSHFDDGHDVSAIEKFPATFVRGRGRPAGPLRAEAAIPDGTTRALRARHTVVVATGSDPAIPDVPGLRQARPWTNREATSVQQVPKRLVTIGAGPVACEMSQVLHGLGAEETTMLVRGDRLLPRTARAGADRVACTSSGLVRHLADRRPRQRLRGDRLRRR